MPASLINDMERSDFEGAFNLACNLQNICTFMHNDSLTNLDCLSSYDGEHRGKKSQNTTECVPVPSSEHVAEIVGRQGCKIKALRAKTNTYIKTPVRGEEPVFVVTGRKEDVCAAKKEIVSAADHFSQIRAQRKNNLNGTLIPGPNSNIPGQLTICVKVPYRVVGLVVGPKGATIKRIQQTTNTYIVTPSRDKDPVFEVTGLPDNVESARKEIEAHIAMRTGGAVDDLDNFNLSPSATNNNINNVSNNYFRNDYGNGLLCPALPREGGLDMDNMLDYSANPMARNNKNNLLNSVFNGYSVFSPGYDRDDTISPTYDCRSACSTWPSYGTAQSSPGEDSNSLFSNLSSERSNSLTSPLVDLINGSDSHSMARRTHSDPSDIMTHQISLGVTPYHPITSPYTSLSAAVSKCTISSSSSLSPDMLAPGSRVKQLQQSHQQQLCQVCNEQEVVAALVPCGHHHFCMECAERLRKEEKCCPVCSVAITDALRLK